MRIILSLILLVGLGCHFVQERENEPPVVGQREVKDSVQSDKRAVSKKDGQYAVSNEVILTNENLDRLINQLEEVSFPNQINVSKIPNFILSFLDETHDGAIEIANKNENWQSGCTPQIEYVFNEEEKPRSKVENDTILFIGEITNKKIPRRQLVFAGTTDKMTLLSYKLGGIGVSQRILIFEHRQNEIIDFWCGGSLVDLNSKSEIVHFLKDNKNKEWGLNTNMVYF